jgi:hypothetical protein
MDANDILPDKQDFLIEVIEAGIVKKIMISFQKSKNFHLK